MMGVFEAKNLPEFFTIYAYDKALIQRSQSFPTILTTLKLRIRKILSLPSSSNIKAIPVK